MRPFALMAAALLLATPNAGAFDVTSCYQTVPSKEVGTLQADLVCDGTGGPDVNLGRRATLEMNGHTISGGYIGVSTEPGGGNHAEINGPGEIVGVAAPGPFGAAIAPASKVTIRNVTLRNNHRGIVSVYDFALMLESVTIIDNAAEGITSYAFAQSGGIGPGKGQIKGRNLVVSGNGDDGIQGFGRLSLRDSTVSGNGGAGVRSRGKSFSLQNVTITDNTGAGLASTAARGGKVMLGTLTGNGPEGDVAAPSAPKFVSSTCGHSIDTDSGGTLGICTGD